jgi:hypothetical protein
MTFQLFSKKLTPQANDKTMQNFANNQHVAQRSQNFNEENPLH